MKVDFFTAMDEPVNGKGQLVQIPDCRCAMGTSVSAGKTDIQDILQKPENRQQMAAIFSLQWPAWTLFWLATVNGSIIWPVPSDFSIYLKLREVHIWWKLFLKLCNINRASNITQFPSSSMGEHGYLTNCSQAPTCVLSSGQTGDVPAKVEDPHFTTGFCLSTRGLTEVQRDQIAQQTDDSASRKKKMQQFFCLLFYAPLILPVHGNIQKHISTSTPSTQW